MENTMMSNGLRRLLIIFGALLVVSLLASGFSAVYVTLAAPQRSTYVPTTIGFEGQLADAQGVPVADGQYTITFTLYDALTGGTPAWSETQNDVDVKDGLYSVQLGTVTAFDADDFGGPRWLAIKVGSDAEMTPRISVGAVPFALNAKYAQGLQNNPVADTAPQTDDALMWTGTQWAPQGMTFPDLAPVGNNASPNDLLANYRSGAILRWKDADTVEVSAGELMVNGYMRRNTSTVDVKFAADAGGNGPNRGLDTGTAQSNTTYYVYAVADDAESTFDLIISASSSAPTGVTNVRKLGSFRTESNNTNIITGSAANEVGIPNFVPSARVYNSGNIALSPGWNVLTLNSERFDNDNIHNISTNTSRLTCRTKGKYLIFGAASVSISLAQRLVLGVKVNSSTNIVFTTDNTMGMAGYYYPSLATAYHLNEGDYVELMVLVTESTTATGAELGMVRLGD